VPESNETTWFEIIKSKKRIERVCIKINLLNSEMKLFNKHRKPKQKRRYHTEWNESQQDFMVIHSSGLGASDDPCYLRNFFTIEFIFEFSNKSLLTMLVSSGCWSISRMLSISSARVFSRYHSVNIFKCIRPCESTFGCRMG
jgi:hypothetical protein